MRELVKEIIENIETTNSQEYTIQKLEEFCSPPYIPKEFNTTENIDEIKDELKAFTLGCELFYKILNKKYDGDNQEIKEAGVYQFLQATLQDEVGSIISDGDYLKNLLELYGKDIEEFGLAQDNGSIIDKYSTVGLIRDINQDSLRVSPKGDILIVADGVGGGEHGEIASQKASDRVFEYLDNRSNISEDTILQDLKNAIMEANKVVVDYAEENSINTIGTTLSVALIYNRKLFFGHVGDSRIYRISKNQEPKLITQDHSLPEVLFRNDEITAPEKENYKKNILVYVIGKKDLKEENLHVGYEKEELTDDTLFLCSDGVWDINKEIEGKFTSKAEDLKRYILDSIPSDNATFVRCKFDFKDTKPIVIDTIEKEEEKNKEEPIEEKQIKEEPLILDISDNIQTNDKKKKKKKRFALIGAGVIGLVSVLYMIPPPPPPPPSPTPNSNIATVNNNTIAVGNTTITSTPIPTAPIVVLSTSPVVVDNNLTDDNLLVIHTSSSRTKEPLRTERPLSNKVNANKKEIDIKKEVIKEVSKKPVANLLSSISTLKTSKIKSNADGDVLLLSNGVQVYLRKKKLTSTRTFKQVINHPNELVCTLKNTKLLESIDLTSQLKVSNSFVSRLRLIPQPNNRVNIRLDIKKGCKQKKDKSNLGKVITFKCQNKKKVRQRVTVKKVIPKKIVAKRKRVVQIKVTRPKVTYWPQSDRLFLDNNLVATFKKDILTLEVGFCKLENGKWVCIIPKHKVGGFINIKSKLKHQKFAKEVVLNSKKSNHNVRIVITLKEGYRASKDRANGKQVLVFKKK